MTDDYLIKDTPTLIDQNLPVFSQIELSIQQMHNVNIPALVFENLSTEEWDYDDLYDVIDLLIKTLTELGELDILETNNNYAIALFTNFFDAFTSHEFLLDNNSFKEIGRVNFILRWFKPEDESKVSKNFRRKIQIFMPSNKYIENGSTNTNNNINGFNNSYNSNKKLGVKNNDHVITNLNLQQQNYNSNFNLTPNISYLNPLRVEMYSPVISFNQSPNITSLGTNINSSVHSSFTNQKYVSSSPQFVYNNNVINSEFNQNINNYTINPINSNINSSLINNFSGFTLNTPSYIPQEKVPLPTKKKNSNNPVEKKTSDKISTEKYTCKYEIQIENNNNDFQVAKKIIGCNGCNMKNIVETCKNKSILAIGETVKLRLRGKGSGYKEGPEMKESEESLHLCVSSKYLDLFNLACKLVEELLQQLYEDYKKYCEKKGINNPILEIKRIEGMNNLVVNGSYMLNTNNSQKKGHSKQKSK